MVNLPLAVLISGRGSNMVAIAQACAESRIDASIRAVISDRPEAGGLERAAAFGLTTYAVPSRGVDRRAFEISLADTIAKSGARLVVLAGFMRILSADFVVPYLGNMLNIHPSLLPKYRGLHTYRRALEAGETEHGSSVHFVTPELDGGPVVLQSRVQIRADETEDSLSGRVQATEHIIYPRVIGWLAEERLIWREGKPWLDGKPLETPQIENFE